ncbi:MAG: AbrB/MazE/SpoVT family DNA-binding domain-containing protein [Nanoarchaeota archaeon]|nr:AbrB/MazE/SpoVT family DNA-binding domain-containing protein [Nanoarchaeota archaeon]MBU1027782.1 AbrB/MazE/SpoVT family DNA-binding domain-containing protein [Nanoarchaeota archaeon]
MKRRVIRQGHNTLTITLPKKWVDELNIKPGDEIDICENQGSLIINGLQKSDSLSTTIDIKGFNIPMVWRFFQSAYREGYNEIRVLYDSNKKNQDGAFDFYTTQLAYEKMGEKKTFKPVIDMLQEVVSRFVGIEIMEHKKDYCVIREMGELTAKEFDNSLRRIFLLIEELFDYIIDKIENKIIGDINICKEIHTIDRGVDRFVDYCCRIINRINDSSFQEKKPIMFSTLFLLELFGDEFKYIGTHLASTKKNIDKILPFAKTVKEHFQIYYNLFYKFEMATAIKFGENDFKIYNDYFKSKESMNKDAQSVRRHFMQISKFIFCLMELRIEMEF